MNSEEATATVLLVNSMKRKLVYLVFWIFFCGVSAAGGFMMFFQDLKGLEGYIAYLRSNWVDLSPIIGGAGMAMNILLCVWAYWQLKEYIAMRERLVLLMAKEVELMERQKLLKQR
jgi:hypothetical protein